MSRNFELTRVPESGRLVQAVQPQGFESEEFRIAAGGGEESSDLKRVLFVLRRRWRAAIAVAGSVTALALLVTLLMTPRYEPELNLQVDPPGSEVFSMDHGGYAGSTDTDYVGTQVQKLQSDDVAISVIRTLHLDQKPEFSAKSWLSPILRIFRRGGNTGGASNGELKLSEAESRALVEFQKRLSVQRSGNSQLITLSVASEDPVLAAQITNTLAENFVDQYYRTRYDAIMRSSQWLSRQLEDIRGKMDSSNQALAQYQKKVGVADVDDKQSTFMQRAAELNGQLTQAQGEKIQYQAFLSRLRLGDLESLPQVHESIVIQGLKQRLAEQRANLSQARAFYGPNHPNIKRASSEVNELEASINHEQQKIADALRTNYSAAVAKEQMMAGEMKAITDEMTQMAQYGLLKKDAQTNTDLYNALYARIKEVGITAASKSSNVLVLDRARVLNLPTSPRLLLNLIVGLIAGCFAGVFYAFSKESLDDTVTGFAKLQQIAGPAPITIIPKLPVNGGKGFRLVSKNGSVVPVDTRNAPFMLERPWSPEAEAVRSLKTSILLSKNGHTNQVLMIASPTPQEGKTTIAVNLAIALAEHGKTCLIDADLRRSMVARAFALRNSPGLCEVLSGVEPLERAVTPVESVPNLAVLASGNMPDAPGQIISIERMGEIIATLRREFRFIVFDTSPLIPFAEGRAIATLSDSVILVGRCGTTTRHALSRTHEILTHLHVPVFGFVLNEVDLKSPDYRSYYGYAA